MNPNDILIFESEEAYNKKVAEMAQMFADMADQWVMEDILRKAQHKPIQFKILGSFKGSDGRMVINVEAPYDFERGTKEFIDEKIRHNGKTYTIIGVEAYAIQTIKKGVSINLWVR